MIFQSVNSSSLVAIHGLNSSATGAWKHHNGKVWVADAKFFDDIKQKVRVMTFG